MIIHGITPQLFGCPLYMPQILCLSSAQPFLAPPSSSPAQPAGSGGRGPHSSLGLLVLSWWRGRLHGLFCLWSLTPPAPACAFQVLSRFPQTLPVNAASCALVKTRGSRLWPQPRSLRCALPCQHTALPVAFVLLSRLPQVCQLYDTIRPSPAQQSAPTRQ